MLISFAIWQRGSQVHPSFRQHLLLQSELRVEQRVSAREVLMLSESAAAHVQEMLSAWGWGNEVNAYGAASWRMDFHVSAFLRRLLLVPVFLDCEFRGFPRKVVPRLVREVLVFASYKPVSRQSTLSSLPQTT